MAVPQLHWVGHRPGVFIYELLEANKIMEGHLYHDRICDTLTLWSLCIAANVRTIYNLHCTCKQR